VCRVFDDALTCFCSVKPPAFLCAAGNGVKSDVYASGRISLGQEVSFGAVPGEGMGRKTFQAASIFWTSPRGAIRGIGWWDPCREGGVTVAKLDLGPDCHRHLPTEFGLRVCAARSCHRMHRLNEHVLDKVICAQIRFFSLPRCTFANCLDTKSVLCLASCARIGGGSP